MADAYIGKTSLRLYVGGRPAIAARSRIQGWNVVVMRFL